MKKEKLEEKITHSGKLKCKDGDRLPTQNTKGRDSGKLRREKREGFQESKEELLRKNRLLSPYSWNVLP